jgi:hypothetical protein
MALLSDALITLDLANAMHGIDQVTRANRQITVDLDKQNIVIKDIQNIGEIVLFCVIAPMYFFETTLKLFIPGAKDGSVAWQLLLTSAILIGCALSAFRIINTPPRAQEPASKGETLTKLAIVGLIGLLAASGFALTSLGLAEGARQLLYRDLVDEIRRSPNTQTVPLPKITPYQKPLSPSPRRSPPPQSQIHQAPSWKSPGQNALPTKDLAKPFRP